MTFVYRNPFGGNLKIEAFNKISDVNVLVPFQAGLRLSGTQFNAYKDSDKKAWEFTGTLYPRQKDLFDEMFPIFTTRGSVLIGAYTSWGKTIQSAHLAASVIGGRKGKVLVVFSIKVLIDSWLETFREYTNARVKEVKKEGDEDEADVLICMVGKLKYITKKVDVLILDEAHTLCTQQILDKLLMVRTSFVIALTATPERDDEMDDVIVALVGGKKNRFILKYNKPFQIFKLDTGYCEEDCNEVGEMLKERKEYKDGVEKTRVFLETCLALHPERNEKIAIFLCRLAMETNFKIAVMANRTEQIDLLYQDLLDSGISVSRLRGNDKNPENSRVLIGDIRKMGIGFDDKTAVKNWDGKRIDLIVYLISTYKLEQSIGRSRAPRPYAIHLVDRHRWFLKSYKDNCKWYQEHLEGDGSFREIEGDPWEKIVEVLATENPLIEETNQDEHI